MKNTLIIFLILLFTSCSGSKITSSWKAKDTGSALYGKILVIALLKNTEAAIKPDMEAHLVGDLTKAGVTAFSAYDEFGPKAFANLDQKMMPERISRKGFDAVMTIVLLNKQQEKQYTPGRIINSPYYVYQNRLDMYYHTIQTRIESEGYYTTVTKYFWESNLYNLAEKRLVYSVQTESFDAATTTKMAHQYGKLIVNHMLSNNVLDSTKTLH